MILATIAQQVEATHLKCVQYGFDSRWSHYFKMNCPYGIESSNLSGSINARLAQWKEHRFTKPNVTGSSPVVRIFFALTLPDFAVELNNHGKEEIQKSSERNSRMSPCLGVPGIDLPWNHHHRWA